MYFLKFELSSVLAEDKILLHEVFIFAVLLKFDIFQDQKI